MILYRVLLTCEKFLLFYRASLYFTTVGKSKTSEVSLFKYPQLKGRTALALACVYFIDRARADGVVIHV